jgi:hypothetical protein
MEDEIVSFETAMLLKEKGFNEPCCHFYEHGKLNEIEPYAEYETLFVSNNFPNKKLYCEEMQCTAPTQSLAQKWLRDTHKMCISPSLTSRWKGINYIITIDKVISDSEIEIAFVIDSNSKEIKKCKTYEEALEEGLINCLKSI